MKRSKRGLIAVMLCITALGLIGASSAQAVKPVWDVNGAELPSTLLPPIQIPLAAPFPYLLTVIVSLHFEILCTSVDVTGGHLKAPNLVLGELTFLGCTAYVNNLTHTTAAANCKPKNGEILTTEVLGELKAGENNVVFAPKAGTTFATVETSASCAVGEEIPIQGVFAVKDVGGVAGLEENKAEHKVEENAAKSTLTALGEPAKIVGVVPIKLAGTHNGQSFRGLP